MIGPLVLARGPSGLVSKVFGVRPSGSVVGPSGPVIGPLGLVIGPFRVGDQAFGPVIGPLRLVIWSSGLTIGASELVIRAL